ncbi:MAG: PilZ domain-containing protein [Candidatus Omnitrophica bacterium]|nr:PilZ domain-containing protein [Candidatus Omnitrophota bacterium]
MMTQERRQAPRVAVYLPVRLYPSHCSRLVETLTKNVSAGGLRFISPLELPVSSDLTVDLLLSNGEEPIVVRAKVMWFQMIPYSEQFDVGVSFHDTPEESQRRLSGYLERQKSSPQTPSLSSL